jgi:hypothetical protein
VDIIPALQYPLPRKNRSQISNKFAGWEYRVRIPEWRGTQIYVEHGFDDMDPRRWGSTFWSDGGHIGGVSVQNVADDGALSANAEYHHTGVRFYEHKPFTSGLTFNRTLMGDPLGNEADGAYLRLSWDRGGAGSLRVDGAIERRYGNLLDTRTSNPHEDAFHFITLVGYPPEWRRRIVSTWSYRATNDRRYSVQLGYERVRDFEFVAGASRNNVLGSFSVELLHW